jgi:hypothetical protein
VGTGVGEAIATGVGASLFAETSLSAVAGVVLQPERWRKDNGASKSEQYKYFII